MGFFYPIKKIRKDVVDLYNFGINSYLERQKKRNPKKSTKELIIEMYKLRDQLKFYLVGGLLANIHTVFRTTQDIDFIIDLQSKDIEFENYIVLLKKHNFPLSWVV
ncbi:MAG: hypothetical protein R6U96_08760 [Promethearchaeia archaeon]